MRATAIFRLAILVPLFLLGCTAKPVNFDLQLKVTLDGRPVKGATVVVDDVAEGTTDDKGAFAKSIARVPEKPIRLVVRKEEGKFRAKPWEKSFSIKPRKENEPTEQQAFTAELQRYVVLAVAHGGQPVASARVRVDGKDLGETPASGEVEYAFAQWPKGGLRISASKEGFGETSFSYQGESGDRVATGLYKEAVVTVEALEDRDGRIRPIKGAAVSVGGKQVGTTGDNGAYIYHHKGTFGETVPVRVSAAGFAPGSFTRQALLGGSQKLRQYFYSAIAERPRTAVLSFVANTSGEDIADVVKKIEESFTKELFDAKTFKQVPGATARNLIKRSKLTLEKIKTAGWRGTELAESVDVIVLGSVARGEEDSYVFETSFYSADGKLVMTQAAIAGSSGSWRIGRAVGEVVENVLATYPLAGVVVGTAEGTTQISLGRGQFSIGGDDVFVLQSVNRDDDGRIVGQSDAGTLKVRRRRDDQTDLQPEALRGTPKIGDRVVRLDVSTRSAGTDKVVVAVKGGKGAEAMPLAGANVYMDQRWVGSTDRKGEVAVPLRLGRSYKLIVYRHGFEQATRKIEPAKAGERYDFALKSFNSLFTVESEPEGAAVYVDDNRIGTTPITKPHSLTLGFHTVRLEAGGDWRPWEEVVEFSQKEESRTGANRIVLHKDFLKLAERAEAGGRHDEAIRLYSQAPKEHPDYAELHHRLGQLYYDDKRDYDRAIAEFELVQAIPEVQELVFKQYAVVYTNMGKAYYAKGEQVYRANRADAVQYFAKAVKALDRARENTRFFPNDRHDEAVHDTYYYRALAYHYLYQATKREALLANVELAWNEYQDFFPPKLRGKPEYDQLREAGQQLAKQIQGQ